MSVVNLSPALKSLLEAALCKHYSAPVSIQRVTPLEGGLTNRCLRIDDSQGGRFVWRPRSQVSDAFAISRSREAAAQSLAATYQLASAPVCQLSEGLLVPWVEGESLDPHSAESQAILIDLLVRIHSMEGRLDAQDVRTQCQHYEQQLTLAKQQTLKQLRDRRQWQLPTDPLAPVVCHMDLGSYNVVIQPNGEPCVLDWEYARLGSACLDIALFCRANGYTPAQVVSDYCALRCIEDSAPVRQAVEAWLPFADYLALCWYEVGASLYGLSTYQEQAQRLYRQLAGMDES